MAVTSIHRARKMRAFFRSSAVICERHTAKCMAQRGPQAGPVESQCSDDASQADRAGIRAGMQEQLFAIHWVVHDSDRAPMAAEKEMPAWL